MAAGAGAAAAAIVQAIKASGVLVRVEPTDFNRILTRVREPLIVVTQGGIFRKKYKYLVSYKGLVFYTQAGDPLNLPGDAEVVTAGRIWIPG